MARAKAKVATNSVGELIAVAEIKDLLLSIDAKLDLLLNGKTTPTQEALATTVTHQKPVGPKDLGPESWTEEERAEFLKDLDGMNRYLIEQGDFTIEEVWEARRSEALGRAEEGGW